MKDVILASVVTKDGLITTEFGVLIEPDELILKTLSNGFSIGQFFACHNEKFYTVIVAFSHISELAEAMALTNQHFSTYAMEVGERALEKCIAEQEIVDTLKPYD